MENAPSILPTRLTPLLASPEPPFKAGWPPASEDHRKAWSAAAFDADYVRRLREGDWETQRHFTRYFGPILNIKVQSRVRSPHLREEVRQETFLRVLMIVRRNGVKHPESLGGLVNSVCNHVLQEVFRQESRTSGMSESVPEPVDTMMGPDSTLLLRQRESEVRYILDRLSSRDRGLLEQIFLEERDKDEVCRTFQVTRDYLRVMLHRAKARFRQTLYSSSSEASTTDVQRHMNQRRTAPIPMRTPFIPNP
jgi:RNA polymerase sigma-70 factor (ECF subfamily)